MIDQNFIIELRREFHRNPELSGEEERTASRIWEELIKMGIGDIRTNVAGHGVIAVLGEKSGGPVVALRADMDALPIKEKTGLSFLSQKEGVMHACGHDAHTAMLLGAAKSLKQMEAQLLGQVILIFQPAEEKSPVGGARPIIQSGALENPKPDAVFGLHVWPGLQVGQIGVKAGYFMGASDRFRILIQGKGGHASMPHETVDAAIVAVQVAQVLQTIVSRNLNPIDAGVVTIGTIHAGSSHNVIPEEAVLEGSVRSFSPETRNIIKERFHRIVQDVVQSLGARVEINYQHGYPVLVNNPSMVEIVRKAAANLLGNSALPDIEPALIAEDFAVYLEQFPGAFFWLGCGFGDPSMNYPLHHPKFNVDERALPIGARMLVKSTLHFLQFKSANKATQSDMQKGGLYERRDQSNPKEKSIRRNSR